MTFIFNIITGNQMCLINKPIYKISRNLKDPAEQDAGNFQIAELWSLGILFQFLESPFKASYFRFINIVNIFKLPSSVPIGQFSVSSIES